MGIGANDAVRQYVDSKDKQALTNLGLSRHMHISAINYGGMAPELL